ncbi:MAG TPA: hypothetical protein VGL11_17740 [Candidatus Binatia bacterium]|jgi:hypothetical protein
MSYEKGFNAEERVTSLFQPDTLLPAQYLETQRRKTHLEPEKLLMLAVLEDAIACFQKYMLSRDAKGRQMFRETEDWVLEEESEWLFSFDNICEVMGFNPQYIRRGLMRWKEAMVRRQPKAKVYQLTSGKRRRSSGVTERPRSADEALKAVGR